jgi:hypothetical protein
MNDESGKNKGHDIEQIYLMPEVSVPAGFQQ